MDKKNKKKTVIKRKTEDSGESEKKAKIMVNRKNEEKKEAVEVVNQVVEVPVEQGQQIVHTGQLVEGNFEQPVFVNVKGEPVQLGPNTVILYEQSGNPSNFAFGGMWTMDSSGRIVMAETIYDVKGELEEEGANFVQSNTEVTTQQVEQEQQNTYQQFELSSGTQVDGQQEYEVAIIENPPAEPTETPEPQVVTNEDQLVATGTGAVRWLNQKYDFVVRKLQLNYDAGVKLLHSQSGCIQCVYLTTPSMQLAFNAVPQFLCIETGIEFNSTIPTVGGTGTPSLKHNVTLFLAEDGNGKSVIVSAGISTLIGEDLTWLLETFKSCNPAWRQVRCVVCDPTKCQQSVRTAFPSAHVTCSVWQASLATARLCVEAVRRDDATLSLLELAARCKTYALALLRGEHTPAQLQVLKRGIIGTGAGTLRLWEVLSRPNGPVAKMDSWLEADNYTNILHKGLERLVTKFQNLVRNQLQLDEFVSLFFNVANQLENERRTFALSRLRDTETLKQSPTDTITQYAYNLMSHQTKLAQKCLDDRAGR
uniref:ZSWIM1/3 RNaseH-like domain-containing protein n=1 Tax=Heliothis virescens TaxID=7102 RepID=A0A2A4JY45_HELVI